MPSRVSPISFGSGSAAALSPAIVNETQEERFEDGLFDREGLSGKGWPVAKQLDPTRYVEFGINHVGTKPLYVIYVQIPLFREAPDSSDRGEHGPRRWVLRWDRDNYAVDLGPEFDMSAINDRSETVYRVELWQHPPTSEAVTFRLYGYDAPSAEGSGGVVVVNRKLFVKAGTRPPLTDIVPRITSFQLYSATCTVELEGNYGRTYGVEKSDDLQKWVSAGVSDKTVSNIETSRTSYSVPVPANTPRLFFRAIER